MDLGNGRFCTLGVGPVIQSMKTVAVLQVKDSKLQILTEGSKSSLPGFYDPCIGEEKSLDIKYR